VLWLAPRSLPPAKPSSLADVDADAPLPTFSTTAMDWPKLLDDDRLGAGVYHEQGIKGRFRGSYLLDQGDGGGLQSYKDKSHSFHILDDKEDTHGVVHVAAQGNTQFGRFVSAGVLEWSPERHQQLMRMSYEDRKKARPLLTLTLARRCAAFHRTMFVPRTPPPSPKVTTGIFLYVLR
jgi:hypothetical protein